MTGSRVTQAEQGHAGTRPRHNAMLQPRCSRFLWGAGRLAQRSRSRAKGHRGRGQELGAKGRGKGYGAAGGGGILRLL